MTCASSVRPLALATATLLLLTFGATSLLASEETAPRAAAEDPFGESPFEEFQRERLPVGQDPDTSEVLPAMRAVPLGDDDLEPPTEARLRFRFDQPMRFDVSNVSRMGFEERPDLRQIYRSGLVVEYHPISPMRRATLPSWRMDVLSGEEKPAGELRTLLATVSNFSGEFEEPHELSDTARTHQILKDAAFSFQISDRGEVFDVRVHPPTNPLARSSMEELIRLFAVAQPVLPEQAVRPGSRWSETISLAVEDRAVVKTQDIELTYELTRWERCGRVYCAVIEVDQEVKAAARMLDENSETRGASAGGGKGWFVIEVESGRIIRSRWNLATRGETTALQRSGDTLRELASSRYHIEVDSTLELLDRDDVTYELVPVEDD